VTINTANKSVKKAAPLNSRLRGLDSAISNELHVASFPRGNVG
jgi:hypothetical protein